MTDTFVNLSHALTVGHSSKQSDSIGILNNFGIGMYVFQSVLGETCQSIIYTVRQDEGVMTMKVARTGSLQDAFWSQHHGTDSSDTSGTTKFMARVIADVIEVDGSLEVLQSTLLPSPSRSIPIPILSSPHLTPPIPSLSPVKPSQDPKIPRSYPTPAHPILSSSAQPSSY